MDKKGFIHYLESKNHATSTQQCYLMNVNLFLKWVGKEDIQISKSDIVNYLDYLKNKRHQENITRRNQIIAISHYFNFLKINDLIIANPANLLKIRGAKKRKLTYIYTHEELDRIYDNYYWLYVKNFDAGKIPKNQQNQSFLCRNRNFVIVGFLIYQGLVTTEINKLHLEDIDLIKGTITLKSSKRLTKRTLALKPAQIGSLINYINHIRPQYFTYTQENEKLFVPLPPSGRKKTETQDIMYFKQIKNQIKTLDKNFIDFRQLRSSVITNWLKVEGLRKAQYLAGHRHIHVTEAYLPNNLENLTDDINKLHPFNF